MAILKAAEYRPATPSTGSDSPIHHELVQRGIEAIAAEEKTFGGTLGRPSDAKYRTYRERLKRHAAAVKGTLFDTESLRRAIDEIYNYPLKQGAIELLNRQLRSGASDEDLAETVVDLRAEEKLCIIHEEEQESQQPHIICSLGLRDSDGAAG